MISPLSAILDIKGKRVFISTCLVFPYVSFRRSQEHSSKPIEKESLTDLGRYWDNPLSSRSFFPTFSHGFSNGFSNVDVSCTVVSTPRRAWSSWPISASLLWRISPPWRPPVWSLFVTGDSWKNMKSSWENPWKNHGNIQGKWWNWTNPWNIFGKFRGIIHGQWKKSSEQWLRLHLVDD